MVYFTAWKIHGFSHQISHSIRKVSETHRMGKTWKIGSHTFSIKLVVFSIRFPSCGILDHIWNACVFSSTSHNMGRNLGNWFPGKSYRTHRMWRTWEIGTHTFPRVWVLFSIIFTFYGVLYHMWNTWVSSSISHSMRKCSEIHRIERAWEIGTHFSRQRMDTFLPSDSHLMVYFITWETHGFSHQSLIARENAAKSALWALKLLFHSMIISTCSKIWWFLKRANRKRR